MARMPEFQVTKPVHKTMSKLRAAFKHLWPSVILLLVIGSLIVFAWYPGPFLQFSDATRFALLLIVIAALIGPALTGLVYKEGKRNLIFDISVIVIIQLTAVAWGTMAIYQNRPFFMVFTVNQFEVLTTRDIDINSVNDKRFLEKPIAGPILLYANMPVGEDFQKLLKEVMMEGKPDLQFRPEYWSLYGEKQTLAVDSSKPLNELRIMRPESVSAIDRLVKKHSADISDLNFIPVLYKNGQFAAILDANSGAVVDLLKTDPWID